MMDYVKKDLEHIWHPGSQMKDYEELPPVIIDHAKGVYLYDIEGNRYIDLISSWWCNLLGHCNERINTAIKNQLDRLEHVIFANFSHLPAITLVEKLSKLTPAGLTKFFFTDNGSSSIEVAMKMSFQYHHQTGNPQKKRFMALSGAYHGQTLGALSVGGVSLYSQLYQPILLDVIRVESPDCYRCKYGKSRESCEVECFEAMETAFENYADETCAIMVEPLVQGAAGMKIYPALYLTKLRQLCDRYNVHLIADEIATGYGRTGKMFACDHAGIVPDMMCLSKSLTGGYLPMALVVTDNKIYDAFYADYSEGKSFLHSHTYSGNPLACSAAVEVLNILEDEDIINTVNQKAAYFNNLITEELAGHKNVGDIRQIGLINAIELVYDKPGKTPFDKNHRYGYQIYKNALKKGLILRPLGDVIYFNPPLIISEAEMELAVKACGESIREVLGA
jgi:adenosylmethionine-8-amino-7-oxononanoate aminotransferase